MGEYSTDFQLKLQKGSPQYCGSGGYRKDVEGCEVTPPPVDIDAYLNWGKLIDLIPWSVSIPFIKPRAVGFCTNFTGDPIYSDDERHCVDLSAEFRKNLGGLLDGLKSATPGTRRSSVPDSSQLYRMLQADHAPPKGFNRRYREKSKQMVGLMHKIADLMDKGDPGVDKHVEDLMEASGRVCIIDDDDVGALENANDDCSKVMDEHRKVKGWLSTGGTIVIGLITALYGLAKLGILPKMIRSARNTWVVCRKRSGPDDKPAHGRFYAFWKAFGNFWMANDPYDEARAEWPLKLQTTMSAGLSHLRNAVEALDNLGAWPFSDLVVREESRRISEIWQRQIKLDEVVRFKGLSPIFFSYELLGVFDRLREGHLKWVLDDAFADVARASREAAAILRESGGEENAPYLEHVGAIDRMLESVDDSLKKQGVFIEGLDEALKIAADLLVVADEDLKRRWRGALYSAMFLQRDIAAIAREALTNLQALKDSPHEEGVREEILGRFGQNDIGQLNANLGIVNRINRLRAQDKGVAVSVGQEPAGLVVPQYARFDLFRIVNEFVVNGIKFSDVQKTMRFVKIKASVAQQSLRIDVKDNGIGMHDIEAAFVRVARLIPELAGSAGSDLPGMRDLARKHEWRVELASTLGEGTTASLIIDISSWGAAASAGRPLSGGGFLGLGRLFSGTGKGPLRASPKQSRSSQFSVADGVPEGSNGMVTGGIVSGHAVNGLFAGVATGLLGFVANPITGSITPAAGIGVFPAFL